MKLLISQSFDEAFNFSKLLLSFEFLKALMKHTFLKTLMKLFISHSSDEAFIAFSLQNKCKKIEFKNSTIYPHILYLISFQLSHITS
jgi:hypothetical protein